MGIMKKVVIGGSLFIGIAGCTAIISQTDNEGVPVQKVAEMSAPKEAPKAKPSPDRPAGDKGVTEDNFNKIVQGDMFGEGGMGKTEVFDMLGNADTFTTSKVNDATIETASWNTKDYSLVIMIQFHNGKVSSKTITKL